MDFNLTAEDVQALLHDPSGENRAATAEKVATAFGDAPLNERERELAEDIFRTMVRDAEVRVRKALSLSLKDNPDIPHDLAMSMAQDVADVAAPILESSTVLSPDDLVDIIRTQTAEHQVAVARRRDVDESVAEALVDTHNENVVATLVSNENARIADETMHRVVDEYGDVERIQEPLAHRKELPVQVVERLVTMVSENLRDHLVVHHDVSPDLASDLVFQSRERAVVGLLDNDDINTEDLVQQLHQNGRLTPTLIVRAACMGDMPFFEAALACLAGIPVTNVYALIHDKGELGFRSLFEKCGMPASLMDISRAAVQVAEETDYDGQPGDRERFRERMIERVLTLVEEDVDPENLDYLISKLGSQTGVAPPNPQP